MKKIALVIRGNERGVFKNKRLYTFLKKYTELFDVDIYIHTWNTSASQYHWNTAATFEKYEITEDCIKTYFDDLLSKIKKIIIDDETKIELVGPTEDNVCAGPCPKICWKRMWYGKHKILHHIYTTNPSTYHFVVNTRFDIFQNSNSIFSEEDIIQKTNELLKFQDLYQIHFLKQEPVSGIDNCYMGHINFMYMLAHMFHSMLDDIANQYPKNFYTEWLVYIEGLKLNHIILRESLK